MFDFYNSSFQVLFSFGYNYPQQIVAKAAGKVKVFHGKIEEKIKELSDESVQYLEEAFCKVMIAERR